MDDDFDFHDVSLSTTIIKNEKRSSLEIKAESSLVTLPNEVDSEFYYDEVDFNGVSYLDEDVDAKEEDDSEVKKETKWQDENPSSQKKGETSNLVVCPQCQKTLKKSSLPGHIRNEHGVGSQQTYTCEHCSKVFRKMCNLGSHIKNVHGTFNTDEVTCTDCGKQFKNPPTLVSHLKSVHAEDSTSFMCDVCCKEFKKRTNLVMHIKDVHTEYESADVTCSYCNKQMKNPNSLKFHIKSMHTDNDGEQHVCDECGKPFRSRKYLRCHYVSTHKTDEQQCDQCFKICRNSLYLSQHLKRMHGPAESIPCDVCSKICTSKARLYHHKKHMHELERCVCDQCGKEFRNKWLRKKHVRWTHDKIRPMKMKDEIMMN